MSTDLPLEFDGWDAVSESIEQFRAVHEESGRFLGKWFDGVGSLLAGLVRDETQWRGECERAQHECEQRATRLDEQERQLAAARADFELARSASEINPPDTVQPPWEELLEQVRQDYRALRESLPGRDAEADPWATILGELTETRGELSEARSEIQRLSAPVESLAQGAPARQANEELRAEIDAMRGERDAMRAERQLLEAELENVRRRAEQLANMLDEQKRTAAEQESYWRGELRRQCSLVERITAQWVQTLPPASAEGAAHPVQGSPEATATASGPRGGTVGSARGDNAALESVRAQFELLQKDAARRRRGSGEST
jgi:DNA repair exonuclease SbcCD ATPase subunit